MSLEYQGLPSVATIYKQVNACSEFKVLQYLLCEIPIYTELATSYGDSPHGILNQLVSELGVEARTIIQGRYFEGKTWNEIAEQLNESHSHVTYVAKKLMKTLHCRFMARCPEYADMVSADGLSMIYALLRSDIHSFMRMRYSQNLETKDISERMNVNEEVVREFEQAAKKLFYEKNKAFIMHMIFSFIVARTDFNQNEIRLMVEFIEGMPQEDIRELSYSKERLKLVFEQMCKLEEQKN